MVEPSILILEKHCSEMVVNAIHLIVLIRCRLCRAHVWNVNDGLEVRIQNLIDRVDVPATIEVIADAECLEVLISVQLLIVSVCDPIEAPLVFRLQDRGGISPEIGASHRYDVGLVGLHQSTNHLAKPVILVGGHVVKLVDGKNARRESCRSEFIKCETERCMSA